MALVGKAVSDFNSSISQYGNLENAVSNYVEQKKNDVYDNWKQGVLSKLNIDQEKKQQMDELIGLGTTIPGAVRGGYKAYKAYQAKKTAGGETKDDSTGSDSTGADEGADKSGEKGDVGDDETPTSSSQPQVEDEDAPTPTSNPAEVEMTPITKQPTVQAEEPTEATIGGGENTPESVFVNKGISAEDLQSSGIPKSTATEEVGENVGEDATKVAGDITEASEATEATEGISSTLSGLAEGLGVVADVAAPVALVGGVAYGLYELFHHGSKKAQEAPKSVANPYIQTAFNTAGDIVLPSESNMLDTVGGHSVF